jgi:transposase
MRKIKECLRLSFEGGLSINQVAKTLGISRGTAQNYFHRFQGLSLTFEVVKKYSDDEIEAALFPNRAALMSRVIPDFAALHLERTKKGVTLRLLWEEYLQNNPNGLRYTQFCEHYTNWAAHLKVHMRQIHIAGEKAFVDYSGLRPCLTCPTTGQLTPVELFVVAWGASHYLYAEAQENQQSENFLMGHVRAFEYFGCVPHVMVPDNLKSAVNRACIYDPDVNRAYADLAEHYGFGVLPARPYKPRDKAKVEVGVQILQRWILARIRNQVFHTLAALNLAIRNLLDEANAKRIKHLGKSRRELFLSLDQPAAKPLPLERYAFVEWLKAKVGIDYCIQVERHYYSVPHQHYGKEVDIRLSPGTVEAFLKGERLCLHARSNVPNTQTVDRSHMPVRHQKIGEWSLERILSWARKNGPHTGRLIEQIIEGKQHPEMGFRPALGVLRLAEVFGGDRLECAANIALKGSLTRLRQVRQLLERSLDKKIIILEEGGVVDNKEHVRGNEYYVKNQGEV